MTAFTFTAEPQDAGQRLDAFLAKNLVSSGLSRSRIQSLIKDGHVTVDHRNAKPSHAMESGECVRGELPEDRPANAQAQDLPLKVLYEDDCLAVLDKASGMVVHPGDGTPDGTVVNALLHHFGALSSIGGVQRPGIVHRLDKETSGCLVVARDDQTHHSLTQQFAGRSVGKIYLAVVQGRPAPDSGRIETQIGRNPRHRQKMAVVPPPAGKHAVTDYAVLRTLGDSSLVRCDLHTGRTHQVRVHMKHLGHPLLGDDTYGRPARQQDAPRLMLHAWKLSFTHPKTSQRLDFTAAIPPEFLPWTSGVDGVGEIGAG